MHRHPNPQVSLVFPVFYLIICLFLVVTPLTTSPMECLMGLIMVCTGIPVYMLGVMWSKKPQGFRVAFGELNFFYFCKDYRSVWFLTSMIIIVLKIGTLFLLWRLIIVKAIIVRKVNVERTRYTRGYRRYFLRHLKSTLKFLIGNIFEYNMIK